MSFTQNISSETLAALSESFKDMPRLVFFHTGSFKMNLEAFRAKQRRQAFQRRSKAPYPRLSEHAGTERLSPAQLLDWSQLAQIWKAWLVLTHAWVCSLCKAAQIKGVCLSQHMHAVSLFALLRPQSTCFSVTIYCIFQGTDILQFELFSRPASAPHCADGLLLLESVICAQVTEQLRLACSNARA